MLPLQLAGVFHELIDGAHFALACVWMRIAKETVGCEGNVGAQASAKNLADGNVPGLPQDVEASEL